MTTAQKVYTVIAILGAAAGSVGAIQGLPVWANMIAAFVAGGAAAVAARRPAA